MRWLTAVIGLLDIVCLVGFIFLIGTEHAKLRGFFLVSWFVLTYALISIIQLILTSSVLDDTNIIRRKK